MSEQKINLNSIENVKKSLDLGTLRVCVIGIGRIGLPTALSFAKSGLQTIGVDINSDLVQKINSGIFPLKDEPGYEEIFNEVLSQKTFSATTKIEDAVPNSDLILLSLPTPMDQNNIPDYSALRIVGKQLKSLIEPGSIIIVESTIEPGFIENEFVELVQNKEKNIVVGKNIGVGVCPETANPGEIKKDFEKLPRLVGGTDKKTPHIITKIYEHVFPVELIKMPNCKTANAVKLTTNVFRDVNIAFVNELAIIFEKLGIDTFAVIEAAKSKYNFQAHYPGPGVGGPCLPVNAYQYLNSSQKIDKNFLKIVQDARKINEHMPDHVVKLTQDAFNECKINMENSNILILGVSYKPNVKDLQLTPAQEIITKLKERGASVHIYDPYFISSDVFDISTEQALDVDTLKKMDAAILVTGHKEFKNISLETFQSMKNPILIDTRGIIDPNSTKKENLIFRGLGRGDF